MTSRRLFVLGAFIAASLFESSAAMAQREGPWCVKASLGRESVSERCDYASFEACNAGRYDQSTAFCVQNPRYMPYWGAAEMPPRKSKKRRR